MDKIRETGASSLTENNVCHHSQSVSSVLLAIQKAAKLWMIDAATLKSAISFRTVQTRNSTYTTPNNRVQAVAARDSLVSLIYTRLFDYLVLKTNLALQKHASQKAAVIGVLDIYGFEIFNV